MQTFPIISKAGGREAVVRIISHPTKGEVGADAVRMWEQRGRMPGYAISDLLAWAEREGVVVRPGDFEPVARPRQRKRRSPTSDAGSPGSGCGNAQDEAREDRQVRMLAMLAKARVVIRRAQAEHRSRDTAGEQVVQQAPDTASTNIPRPTPSSAADDAA